jgi:hypothetical protein
MPKIRAQYLSALVFIFFALFAPRLSAAVTWQPIAEGGATVDFAQLPNTNAVQLTVTNVGARAGFLSRDIVTQPLQAGQSYDLNFAAQTERRTYALTVSLESLDGQQVYARTTLPEIGGPHRPYSVALNVRQSTAHCRLVITMSETGTISLDDIALVLRQP